MLVGPINNRLFTLSKMDTLAGNVKTKYANLNSTIMKSIDPNINNEPRGSGDSPICNLPEGLQSLNLEIDDEESMGVLLLDDKENLRFNTEDSFLKALNIPPNEKVKVVSIFGNTGEGKSYTLNKVFFDGEEVFRTSTSQVSCTLGVWAKYNSKLKVICLDTEGLLGISTRENQRKRLLLKVLAISDIVIYRTRAERLQTDMYTFLGGASKAYKEHFSSALTKALIKSDAEKYANTIGPGVIIFHETRYTETLHDSVTESAEDIMQSTFAKLNLTYDAFSFIKYIGVKTPSGITSFRELSDALLDKLDSTEIRCKRDAKYVYLTLKSLNDKFNNQLNSSPPQLYLPTFFTCPEKCQSCKHGCNLSMGHQDEGEPHQSNENCVFQYQYQNSVYLCKICHKNGARTIVKRNNHSYIDYVWSGYTIECPKHGEIYRSRQYWFGNKDPEDSAVRLEIVHIWSGEWSLFGSPNSAQKIVDGATYVSGAIASVGSQPTRAIADWVADKIAPTYWRPNHEIKECFKCKKPFPSNAQKHHCRSCGEGFCEPCSSRRQPVPSKGWYEDVRVCDACYKEEPPSLSNAIEPTENRARQIGERIVDSLAAVRPVFDYPRNFIIDSARPGYWVPDSECTHCDVCRQPFGPLLSLHHCRECGKGVCDECSGARKPVPLHGWIDPVRVCNNCRS